MTSANFFIARAKIGIIHFVCRFIRHSFLYADVHTFFRQFGVTTGSRPTEIALGQVKRLKPVLFDIINVVANLCRSVLFELRCLYLFFFGNVKKG